MTRGRSLGIPLAEYLMGWLTMSECRAAKDVHDHVLGPQFCGANLKSVAHFSAAYGRRFWVVFEHVGGEPLAPRHGGARPQLS